MEASLLTGQMIEVIYTTGQTIRHRNGVLRAPERPYGARGRRRGTLRAVVSHGAREGVGIVDAVHGGVVQWVVGGCAF